MRPVAGHAPPSLRLGAPSEQAVLRVSEVEALVDAALQETFGKMKQGESAEHARRLGEYFATLATTAKDAGTTLVGDVLKLDDTNEADQTDGKIAACVETIKG